jgi:hypothetical protein
MPDDDDPRRNSVTMTKIAVYLPMLSALENELAAADWYPERLACAGLLLALANLVADDTTPGSPEHKAALLGMRTRRRQRGTV